MKLSNYQKKLVLELLEAERFNLCQHYLKIGHPDLGQRAAKSINDIIDTLELRVRDQGELHRLLVGDE